MEDTTMPQSLTLYRLPHVGIDWEVATSLAVEACLAGQAAYGDALAREDMDLPVEALPEVPTDREFNVYFQRNLPADLSAHEEAEWRAYFMVGWYSRLFCLGA
jgi:hypothetical protein